MRTENDGQHVIKAGVGYTIGNILVKGIAFLTIPVFTVLMSTEQYGLYNTFAAYVSIMAVVVSLGLPSSVRNVRYDLPKEEREYHVNSTILILAAFLVFFSSIILGKSQIVKLLGLSFPLILIVVVNSTCTALQSYYNNILTIDFRYHQFLKLSFFYSISSVLLSIVFIRLVYPNNAALGRALGNMLPMAAIAIYVLIHIWRNCRICCRKKYIQYGLRFGLPLIPNDLSSLILAQFDRIMIYRSVGESEAGLYSFAYNVAVIFQVITNSIESAWTPWMFSRIYQGEMSELKKRICQYVAALTVGTSMLILPSPEIIMLLSGSSYWDSKEVVVPILFAMYFFAVAAVPVGIEFFYRRTSWISFCTLCTAVCNIVLNLLFIPMYGYQAAAYTTLVCYFLYALFHMMVAGRLGNIYMLHMPVVLGSIVYAGIISGISIMAIDIPAIRWSIELLIASVVFFAAFQKRTVIKQVWADIIKKRKN